MKEKLTYIIALLYISIPVGIYVFHIGVGASSGNQIIDTILFLLLIPVSIIIFILGLLGGKIGALIGTIITIGIAVFLIERFFKKTPLTKLE